VRGAFRETGDEPPFCGAGRQFRKCTRREAPAAILYARRAGGV